MINVAGHKIPNYKQNKDTTERQKIPLVKHFMWQYRINNNRLLKCWNLKEVPSCKSFQECLKKTADFILCSVSLWWTKVTSYWEIRWFQIPPIFCKSEINNFVYRRNTAHCVHLNSWHIFILNTQFGCYCRDVTSTWYVSAHWDWVDVHTERGVSLLLLLFLQQLHEDGCKVHIGKQGMCTRWW
jgi:hypothetical protein